MPPKTNSTTLAVLLAILALALGLAWFSSSFTDVEGFFPFTFVLILGVLVLWLAWRLIQPEEPGRWLLYVIIGAALLRLIVGVFWFWALPAFGHPNETQQSGYIMFDAFRRDTAAWELSQSDEPLLSAFRGASHMDQYGGMLFISGFIYRFLAAGTHYPLMMVVVTAAFSAAAAAFTWALSKRLWGEQAAKTATWLLALYPEAVLLGSSQMREAFTITLVTAFSYFLLGYLHTRQKHFMYGIVASVLLTGLISWPVVVIELFIAVIVALAVVPWDAARRKRLLPVLGVIVGLAVVLVVIGFMMMDWWQLVIDYQVYTTVEASGKLDAVLGRTPEWLHLPFLVVYGVLQPLLPAALVAFYSGWLPYTIAIWRAVGWTLLLVGLLYASFLAVRQRRKMKVELALITIVWVWILTASVRGGGDMWDNPRYRVAIAGIQVGLAAWAYHRQRALGDPWLRRVLVFSGIVIAFFLAWYIDRRVVNYGFPIPQLNTLVFVSLAAGAIYLLADWWRTREKSKP